jgi:hypothetical protein
MISASQLALTAQASAQWRHTDFLVKELDEFLQALFHYYQITTADSE